MQVESLCLHCIVGLGRTRQHAKCRQHVRPPCAPVSRLPPNDSARPARDHETPRKTDPHSPYSSPALTIARGSLALTRSSKAAGHQTCESLAVRYVAGQCTQNPRKEEHVRLHKTRLPRGGQRLRPVRSKQGTGARGSVTTSCGTWGRFRDRPMDRSRRLHLHALVTRICCHGYRDLHCQVSPDLYICLQCRSLPT
jgi:hypothetical protein